MTCVGITIGPLLLLGKLFVAERIFSAHPPESVDLPPVFGHLSGSELVMKPAVYRAGFIV